ncbi:left-handed beta-roll domain-containing protein [Helicobacter pylori]|nr:left-handed beta-roll domain-containing protein [Helicobacter pylori]
MGNSSIAIGNSSIAIGNSSIAIGNSSFKIFIRLLNLKFLYYSIK